jgi:prepilin-type N-terminal cleavage/methylation domain-containing protein
MRQGFTLIEIMLVLALMGIALGVAIPPLIGTLDRIEVAAAASHIAAAHTRARLLAITRSQVVVLTVDSLALAIHSRGSPAPLWSENGPAQAGISLMGSGRAFTLSPEGFSLGLSNATFRVSRGKATRAVIVSRLGRVRIVP